MKDTGDPSHLANQSSSHCLTPTCKAFLRQCGTLKTHRVHRGTAISDLLSACADFRFILQQAERPREEDPAKSPRSVRNNPHQVAAHRLYYQALAVISFCFCNSPPTSVLCHCQSFPFECGLFRFSYSQQALGYMCFLPEQKLDFRRKVFENRLYLTLFTIRAGREGAKWVS